MATIIESKLICKQPGRYIGWPTVGVLPRGEILAVFSGDRDAHVCPFGKTQLVRSTDNGETWSTPETVNNTPLDDRDAGLCVCPDGSIVVSWFTSHHSDEGHARLFEHTRKKYGDNLRPWAEAYSTVTLEDIRIWAGESIENGRFAKGRWTRRSTDGGRTWEEPVRTQPTAPHGPALLSDGRLLFVGSGSKQGESQLRGELLVSESRDVGRSWQIISHVNKFPRYPGAAPSGYAYLTEPHVTEPVPGRLVAMARYEERPRGDDYYPRGVLWQFESLDGGHSWTIPHPTELRGKPPHLLTLRDGRVLVSYGHRYPPFGHRACFSYDGGKTWDYENEIVLVDDAPSNDLGYPASAELPDGRILTVYYQQERAGEKTCLMATVWK